MREEVIKVLAIPALGETAVPAEDACGLNTLNMRRLGQIEVRPAPSEFLTNLPRAIVIFGWLAVGLCFGAWALFFGGAGAVPWAWVVATVVLVPVIALLVATFREVRLYLRFRRYRATLCEPDPGGAPGDRRSVEGIERGSRIRSFVDGVPRQAAEVAVLIGAVLVSVIGLGVAIHQTTQLNELLPIDYGAIFQLDNPFGDVGAVARESPAFWQLLVGHVAQWILVSVAALAPAAMYFQFDRQRLAAVQRRWVQEVFRLDPTVRTVRDIEAKYGSQIEASFGDLAPDSGLRLRSGRRSPVIVATILLVVGWFLVISTTQGSAAGAERRPARRRVRLVAVGRRGVPRLHVLPTVAVADRLRVPGRVRLHAVPRDPRVPPPRSPPEDVQHDRRANPRRLRDGARGGRRLQRSGR